jgi:methanogenic corrinoid protein MtbC1
MADSLLLSAGHQLRDQAQALAETTVSHEFGRNPRLRARYGPAGRDKSRQDAVCHFVFLADALDVGSPALFMDYVAWAKVLLVQRGVSGEDMVQHLACMAYAVRELMPPPVAAGAVPMIDAALAEVAAMPGTTPSLLDPGQRLFQLAGEYVHALLGGYRAAATRMVLDAAERGEPVRELYLEVLQPALWEIGRLWQMNRINVAQEHFCSAATEVLMSQLLPQATPAAPCGHGVVVVCVSGDLHGLSARMVADFFDMAGWDTYFCGANTPHAAVVEAVVERGARVLAVSASMVCHLHTLQALIAQVRADVRCAGLRVMVGGHPFSVEPALWQTVGADGTAADAQGAVQLANRWMAPAGLPAAGADNPAIP